MSDKPSFNDYAFPTRESNPWGNYHHHGMTLRDYFAAKAMQGDLASLSVVIRADDPARTVDAFANHWYRIADAMLKAREQK